jgi:hypothetical protein
MRFKRDETFQIHKQTQIKSSTNTHARDEEKSAEHIFCENFSENLSPKKDFTHHPFCQCYFVP